MYEELQSQAFLLMTDQFGNYVIQKLLDHGGAKVPHKCSRPPPHPQEASRASRAPLPCTGLPNGYHCARSTACGASAMLCTLTGVQHRCAPGALVARRCSVTLLLAQVRSQLGAELRGRILELTVDTFGCRIVQKAFEVGPRACPGHRPASCLRVSPVPVLPAPVLHASAGTRGL